MVNIQDIISKTGVNGTSIKKLTSAEKKELNISLKELHHTLHDIPDDFLLRAYLAVGEPINQGIKSVENLSKTLNLNDILRYAKNLSKKEAIIDAGDLFQAISDGIKQNKSAKIIKPIINNILKWGRWVESIDGKLTEVTEKNIIIVIKELISLITKPKSLDDKIIRKYKNLLQPLLEILFNIALKSKSYETYILSLEVVNNIISSFPSTIVNDLISNDSLTTKITVIKENIFKETQQQVLIGNVEKIRKMYRIIRGISFFDINVAFKEALQNIWENQGAVLTEDMQAEIKYILFGAPISQKIFKISEAEVDISIKQLATALISAWEARNAGPLALNSFNIISSVAQKYFNLKLGGDVGNANNFNKIVHEPLQNRPVDENAQIIISRPWVEWEGPKRKEIIIKALIKPKD